MLPCHHPRATSSPSDRTPLCWTESEAVGQVSCQPGHEGGREKRKKLHIPHSHTIKLDYNYFISSSCVFHHFVFPVSNVTRKMFPSQVIQSSFFTIKMRIYPFLTCATVEKEEGKKKE